MDDILDFRKFENSEMYANKKNKKLVYSFILLASSEDSVSDRVLLSHDTNAELTLLFN